MRYPWNTQVGFQILNAQIKDTIVSAVFAVQPIVATDVLSMILAVILATGMFHSLLNQD